MSASPIPCHLRDDSLLSSLQIKVIPADAVGLLYQDPISQFSTTVGCVSISSTRFIGKTQRYFIVLNSN
jgi:hypothetical protein